MEHRFFFNEDDDHFFYTRGKLDHEADEGDILRFIDQYAGTGITDFLLNVNAQLSSYPSVSIESRPDKYVQKTENGVPVDYSGDAALRAFHGLFCGKGIDFYAVAIRRLREHGIVPWLSIRMNDCHDNAKQTSPLLPEYWHRHPELKRIRHRPCIGYFDRCWDYGEPEIRSRMLSYIRETMERYDPDGLELDFQREMFLFRIGHEWENIPVLTGMIREVRSILDGAERKRGHRIRLSVRVCADPQAAFELGVDVAGWAREGLLDLVTAAPRWDTANFDMPVELWKRLLEGTKAELAACIEMCFRSSWETPIRMSCTEHVYAQIAAYHSMGVQDLYLMNHMDAVDADAFRQVMIDHALLRDGESTYLDDYGAFLRRAGDPEGCLHGRRRHAVTFDDIVPMWHGRRTDLPVHGAELITLRVRTGRIPEGMKAELRISMQGRAKTVYANSRECVFLRNDAPDRFLPGPVCVYELENDGSLPPFTVVELIPDGGELRVDALEVYVYPPETDGQP